MVWYSKMSAGNCWTGGTLIKLKLGEILGQEIIPGENDSGELMKWGIRGKEEGR